MFIHIQKQDVFDLVEKHNANDNLLKGSEIQELDHEMSFNYI